MFDRMRIKNYAANTTIWAIKNSTRFTERYGYFTPLYKIFAERGDEADYFEIIEHSWRKGYEIGVISTICLLAIFDDIPLHEAISLYFSPLVTHGE
jgi:hypothetical protein